ncbi:WGR domain-containing protein [Microvirga sp. 0TCS3.31]
MPDGKIQYLVLDRCDPGANMARFYVLSIEESLFGDATLIREWGRIALSGSARSSCTKARVLPWRFSICVCAGSKGGATSRALTEDKALPGGIHRIQSAPSPGADLPPDP